MLTEMKMCISDVLMTLEGLCVLYLGPCPEVVKSGNCCAGGNRLLSIRSTLTALSVPILASDFDITANDLFYQSI